MASFDVMVDYTSVMGEKKGDGAASANRHHRCFTLVCGSYFT
jgi:hypothetical protein